MGILAVILILIAAIVGGVMGSHTGSSGKDEEGSEPTTSRSSEPGRGGGATASTSTVSNDKPGASAVGSNILSASRVGSALAMPFEDPYRVAAFLDADGHLATSIWTGTTMESFPLTSDTDSVLPKPAKSSPLHLIVLYQRDYVHILYVDEDHFLCLATMDARADRRSAKWSGGRLKTGKESTASGELETHQTTGDMRVTFETHNNAGDVVDGRPADRVNILYEEGSKKHREKDGYTLLSSIAPEIPSMWTVSRYRLSEEEKESMNPQEESQGITFLPIFKDPEKEPGQQSGVRIIWDLSNEDHDSSFGVIKCKAKGETELHGCWFDMGHWESEYQDVEGDTKTCTR